MNRNQTRHPTTLGVRATNRMTGRLRSDHDDIEICPWRDLSVVDIKPMGKRECCILLNDRGDFVGVDRTDILIGHQQHHNISILNCVFNLSRLQTCLLDFCPGWPTLANPNHHLTATVIEIECVRMALRAVADNCNFLSLNQGEISIFVIKHIHLFSFTSKNFYSSNNLQPSARVNRQVSYLKNSIPARNP